MVVDVFTDGLKNPELRPNFKLLMLRQNIMNETLVKALEYKTVTQLPLEEFEVEK